MLLPLFILAYLASSQAWVIETNVDVIVPGSTENVEVLCKHNTSMKDRLDKGTITRIRIARIDPFGHKTSLAELSTAANKTSKGDEDVLVTWGRDQRQTFLKITWLVATDTTSGAYGCDIHGFDETDEFVNREVPPLMIKEKTLTMDDVKNLIRSETLDMYHKQEEMKASLASLQTLASQEMAAILQEIEDYEAKQRQEIDKLQHNINSTYATKQEVSGRLAELKKFTMTELMSKKNSDDRKREEIFKAITNASTTCERKLSETSSELANIKKSFSNELKSLNENDKKASGKMDATFKELTREINKIDVKYGRIFKNVSEGLEKKLSENVCSCPTAEPRTTSAVTPSRKVIENSVDWPDGKYALVAPPSGCPDPERLTVNGRRLFKPQMYYDNKLLFKDVRDGPLKRLFKIYISTGTTKSELSYCYKDDSSNTRRWPEGNYCINHPTPCPAGFTPGSTMYFNQLAEEKKTYLGSFQVRYCCRSDGRASSPIRLPTEKPFYLYRYKDACQSVEGMRVSDHYVQILVAKNVKIYKVKPTGDHPYTNRYHNPVSLCYYQSSTTNSILTNNKPKDGDDDKGDNKEKRPDHSKDRDDDDDDASGSGESREKGPGHSKERHGDDSREKGPGHSKERHGDDSREKGPGHSKEGHGDGSIEKGSGHSKERHDDGSREKGPVHSRERHDDDSREKGPGHSKERHHDSREKGPGHSRESHGDSKERGPGHSREKYDDSRDKGPGHSKERHDDSREKGPGHSKERHDNSRERGPGHSRERYDDSRERGPGHSRESYDDSRERGPGHSRERYDDSRERGPGHSRERYDDSRERGPGHSRKRRGDDNRQK